MSCFREYLGIAAQTLMGDAPTTLEVFIPELLPMLEGDVDKTTVDLVNKLEITVKNYAVDGISSTQITPNNTFRADYLGVRTGMSMPNIHLGEQIRVFQFKDTTTLYWAPLGRDDSIRKTEHVKIHVANKKKTLEDLTDDTTYFIEMDTREGRRKIHIHTSNGTDEEVTYDLLIDTDKSEVSLLDSLGNGFHMMSKEYWMKVFNSEEEHGCFWEIDKDNIHMHAVKEYKVTCDTYVRESITSDTITTKATTRESTDSIDTHTMANKLVADATDETETATQTVKASTGIMHETPVEGITGSLLIGGVISSGTPVPAGSVPSAPTENEIRGGVKVSDGDITATGDVIADSEVTAITLLNHKHTADGASTVPGPTSKPDGNVAP